MHILSFSFQALFGFMKICPQAGTRLLLIQGHFRALQLLFRWNMENAWAVRNCLLLEWGNNRCPFLINLRISSVTAKVWRYIPCLHASRVNQHWISQIVKQRASRFLPAFSIKFLSCLGMLNGSLRLSLFLGYNFPSLFNELNMSWICFRYICLFGSSEYVTPDTSHVGRRPGVDLRRSTMVLLHSSGRKLITGDFLFPKSVSEVLIWRLILA